MFTVLVFINPFHFIYLVSNLFIFLGWMQRWGWRCVIYPWSTERKSERENSHVTDNHKVNMSIIHCSYDLIYQHLNYLFSLSLYLTIYIRVSQYFHIHFNRIAAEWFMGGWLGHALHVKGHPCWWKKQTWTQSGVFELLSPAAPEEELGSQWTLDVQEDIKPHRRVKISYKAK